jgi:hypothetical protein
VSKPPSFSMFMIYHKKPTAQVKDIPAMASPKTALDTSNERDFSLAHETVFNRALKDVIRELQSVGVTYKTLQDVCGVEENSIKQFMFRKSKRPRATSFARKLCEGILGLNSIDKLVNSTSLALVSSFAHRDIQYRAHSVQYQLHSLRAFISNQMFDYRTGNPTMIMDAERLVPTGVRLFCYKTSRRSSHCVEKSEYLFYRSVDTTSSECFFTEHFLERGLKNERHGIAKMTENLIVLFCFDGADLAATHVKCFPEKQRAHGVSILSTSNGLSIDLEVFVPEQRITNKNLGILDYQSNYLGDELMDFKEGYHEMSRSIS